MSYSLDFRKQVLKIKERERLSFRKTAKRFGVGSDTLVRWSRNISLKVKRTKPTTKVNMEVLKKDIRLYPDAYHHERARRLECSKSGIYYALKRLKITYKKSTKTFKSERRRTAHLPTRVSRP